MKYNRFMFGKLGQKLVGALKTEMESSLGRLSSNHTRPFVSKAVNTNWPNRFVQVYEIARSRIERV